jgi:hypothetical protein
MNTFGTKWHKVARLATKVARKWHKVAMYCLGISAVTKLSLGWKAFFLGSFRWAINDF